MIAPKAEIPTWATPPDTLPAPRVISPACFANVSREPLLLLRTLPRLLCLARSTICGKWWLKSCTAPLSACTITSATAAMTTMIASTSSVEHTRRLQPSRRSIPVANGERTATPKPETKMTSRTLLIDAIEAPTATTMATDRIVRIEIETPISRRLPSLDVVATGASVCVGFIAGASRGRLPRRCHGPRSCCLRLKRDLRERQPVRLDRVRPLPPSRAAARRAAASSGRTRRA